MTDKEEVVNRLLDKRSTKIMQISIWDFMDIETVNEVLDEKLRYKFVASDIGYECKGITKEGILTLEATFDKIEV